MEQTTQETTLYERWNNDEPGTKGFGSFQSTMMLAYSYADGSNRAILERAFPWWFMTKSERLAFEKSQRLLSDEIRENLLVSAIEGGSNYWYYLPDVSMCDKYGASDEPLVTKMFKAIMAGERIPVTDCGDADFDDEDAEHLKDGEHRLGYLSLENMDKAERLMMEQHPEHFADAMSGNDDATTGDVFFQLIVMGEVQFG